MAVLRQRPVEVPPQVRTEPIEWGSFFEAKVSEPPAPCARRTRAPNGPKKAIPQKPYDDPKFASHVLYLSANNFADGFVPLSANDTSSCVTRFAPIKF